MCGIFGTFRPDGARLHDDVLAKMGRQIRHRGPDDHGVYSGAGIALGNQRLSVIDIEGGHQPFVSDDGSIVVVQNGEIYNYQELAKELAVSAYPCRSNSDTEVLLRLYEREGIDFVSRLNGMFAIAIWDGRRKILHLVRDRIGIKPLYIHTDDQQTTFASEIKALFPALATLPAVNQVAIHHFLTFNYVPPPITMYQGVTHVQPGHRVEISSKGLNITRWWDLASIVPDQSRNEGEWIEEFNAVLVDAVRLRMRSDVPFGAFLSGGVDSSTIVGLMSRFQETPIKTFCIGFDDPRFDESSFAQEAAHRFNADHTVEIVNPDMLDFWPEATYFCDQPHGDVSFLPTHRVASLAARQVKVVLTGDGGDELFAGYDKYKTFFNNARIDDMDDAGFKRQYFNSISLFADEAKYALYKPSLRSTFRDEESYSIAATRFDRASHQDRINQTLYLDMELLLSGNNVVKPDRMGMAVSLEARTPFLDYRMMELAFQMPGSLKLKNNETKYLYKKAVEPLIGQRLTYRKKQMFTVPVGEWFKNRLESYCRNHINSLIEQSNMFDSDYAHGLLDKHVSGTENNTRELRALIALDHWFNMHHA